MGAAAAPLMGLQAAGMGLSMYGNYQSGQTNSAIDAMNASYARTLAQQTMATGEYQAGVADIRGGLLSGQQAASYASQGVVSGAGSAATTVQASEAVTEADKAAIRLNASRQAYGYEIQASSLDFQAKMQKRMGWMGAVQAGVSGAGQMAFTSAMMPSRALPGPQG